VWAETAKWLAKYPEAVVTALDVNGYPFSVRQSTSSYNARTGELPVELPETLRPTSGPANLLCHKHDEALWNLSSIQIAGVLDRGYNGWVFVSSAFTPPSRLALLQLSRRSRATSRRYLAKRRLEAPKVNWVAVKQVWKEVRAQQQTRL
jgi:hypothetical protein